MIPSFKELVEVDVTPNCKKRDGQLYLPWARCKKLLHDNGAEKVYFEPLLTDAGSSLFMTPIAFVDKYNTENRCYEVRVKITVDNDVWITNYPLLNGNNPVKDNSLNQLRVNNAQARAFVKGVAVHTGLGFSLWLDDEEPLADDLSSHSILAIKKRVEETLTALTKRGMSDDDVLSSLKLSRKDFKIIMDWYDKLGRFETTLNKL